MEHKDSIEAVTKEVFTDAEFQSVRKDESFQEQALNFFNKYTGGIEIVRGEKTEMMYFPMLPYAESLHNEQKSEWLQELPIGKPRAKLDHIMGNSLDYLQQLKNEYLFAKIFRYYPVFGALAKQIPLWKSLAFYMAIVINLVILFSYRKPENTWEGHLTEPSLFDYFSVSSTKITLFILGMFLTTFLGIVVMSFLYKYVLSTYYRLALEYESKGYKGEGGTKWLAGNTMFILEMLFRTLVNWELIYNVANLTLAIFGCVAHPLFFSYHMFIVAFRSKKLQAVLNAVTGPVGSILLTLVLYIVMEYLFAVIGYVVFPDNFPESTCGSLIDCFVYIIDYTYKGNNGVGESLEPVYEPNNETEEVKINYVRVIYDFAFTLTIMLIVVQLLSGLIIDKFRSLRNEAESREKDLMSTCIICSENAEIIERRTRESFIKHCNTIHNVWFYLMFIGYLMRKPKLDFNGVESYVYQSFKKANLCWLPYSL